jgi:putative transport protein
LTLRQFGLALFSAGIGTRAGFAFFSMVESGDGLQLLALGAALTLGSGILTMLVGFLVFRIPLNILLGVYAGAQTQPVSLGFATEQTKNDLPAQAYAAMFPIATLYKIVVGQALLILLGISD